MDIWSSLATKAGSSSPDSFKLTRHLPCCCQEWWPQISLLTSFLLAKKFKETVLKGKLAKPKFKDGLLWKVLKWNIRQILQTYSRPMVVTGFTACNPSFWQDRKTCLEAFQAFQSFGVVRTRYPSPQSLTYVYNGSPAAPQKNQQPNANKPAVFLEASEASTKSITIPDFLEQRQRYYKKNHCYTLSVLQAAWSE